MLKLAALAVAAMSATQSPALLASSPWWEKITVTMTSDGSPQSCRFESSLKQAEDSCDVTTGSGTAIKASASGSVDEMTRITFERRFVPGTSKPDVGKLHPGDTFLGGQIMALAIDASGEVKGCDVVATSGKVKPDYGCEEAVAERFDASVSAGGKQPRQGYLTILVYGHSENVA